MSGVSFSCPECQAVKSVNRKLIGRTIRCPECGTSVLVQDEAAGSSIEGSLEQLSEEDVYEHKARPFARDTLDVEEERDGARDNVMASVNGDALYMNEALPSATPNRIAVSNEEELVSHYVDPGVVEDAEAGEQVDFGARNQGDNEMDMTPMVDVTFLLLIFFMITASFSSERVIQQRTSPKDNSKSSVPDVIDTLTVRIDDLNTFLIMLPDESEREAPSKQDLLVVLAESKREGVLDSVERVIIEAHEESVHASVVAALDAARSEGFSNFQVKVVPEFD